MSSKYDDEVERRNIIDGYEPELFGIHYYTDTSSRIERTLSREQAHDGVSSYNTAMESLERLSQTPTERAEAMRSIDGGVTWEPDPKPENSGS